MSSTIKLFKIWAQAFALIILFVTIVKLIEGADRLRLATILQVGGAAALFLLIDMLVMARVNVRSTSRYIAIELAILLPCYLAAGWIFNWYSKDILGLTVFLAAFFAIYALVFTIQRQQLKMDAQKLNEKLKKYAGNEGD